MGGRPETTILDVVIDADIVAEDIDFDATAHDEVLTKNRCLLDDALSPNDRMLSIPVDPITRDRGTLARYSSMQRMEHLLPMLMDKMRAVSSSSPTDMIQSTSDQEAIEVAIKANTIFRIDRVRRPRKPVGAIPANINPTPTGTRYVEAAVGRDFQTDPAGISNREQALTPSGSIRDFQAPNFTNPSPVYGSLT